MVSVTTRINEVKQPRGGYINPKAFIEVDMGDNDPLPLHDENIHASLVGLAVDYLTRSILTHSPVKAFKISLLGASLARESNRALKKAESVVDLSAKSIVNACQLAGYDVVFRQAVPLPYPVEEIRPDTATIAHIKTMTERSLVFFGKYGPVVEDGFTFDGGYTSTVDAGDGDFITADTLWDFKVSVKPPTNKHTLQLLMYYLMGLHSSHENLHAIKRLGVFNPRLNKVYLLDVSTISLEILRTVETDVIGYR
ncbi:MAG: hypothetical protein LBK42_01105 [Propionibacteriaceae bacterium]|jgi:hypothetical protein|nr:hypothetical protein [Propionibacteriaceae bacterium]